ncbi:MAG: MFS transporter [Peptoniphilaceae bacterium]|nr:MFS transporter [Peptoniphilaceae bacterium]MDD7382754.1 MFS transporter [Peptoniphilaceae bacterium]MDY3737910.1 MFS transporter [Peptoniphilaceae bacterium]
MSQPSILLSKSKRIMVQIGCICLILTIQMFGLTLSTLQSPILKSMNAMQYFSIVSIVTFLGLSIMTPIGGKLGDLLGRRNLVFIAGIICTISGIGISISQSIIPFLISVLFLGVGMGSFISVPYILAREVNEAKDVPKIMGMLSSALAGGGLLGGIIAGFLADLGYLRLGILVPLIPLILGVLLIVLNLPNIKREGKVSIDVKGVILLVITIVLILLPLNLAGKMGLLNVKVIVPLLIGILFLFIFVKAENKVEDPIIPMHLFENKSYVLLLVIGFICYFYLNTINIYAPSAVINVLGKSKAAAGSLQLARTILTIVLPVFVGTWISKRKSNYWRAMIIATLFVAIPMIGLSFTSQNTSLIFYIVMISITGIAESFRAVSITPSAQSYLDSKDLGVGTSLLNFINTLSGLIAALVFGMVYDLKTKANPQDVINIMHGVNLVYLTAAIVTAFGLIIVIFAVKKLFKD